MADLNLKKDSLSYYLGWYGSCEPDTPCESFTLNENMEVYNKIHKVIQVNTGGKKLSLFDGSQILDDELSQANQDFNKLECGKCYLVILDKGTDFLQIPHFTTSDGKLKKGCFDNVELIGDTLIQSTDEELKYFGWFGICGNNQSEYDLTSMISRQVIKSVIKINSSNSNYESFISDVNPVHDKYQDFTKLESGSAYYITLKKGDDKLESLTNFVSADKKSNGRGLLTHDCDAINKVQLKSQEVKLTSNNIDVHNTTWKNSTGNLKVDSFNVLFENTGGEPYAYFDGSRGGCLKVPHNTHAQEISVGVKFELNSTQSSVIDCTKNLQYLIFQENNRSDSKNGAFFMMFQANDELGGNLKIGTFDDNGFGSSVTTKVVVKKIYHVFFVITKTKIKLYINGKYMSESTKSVGIDYNLNNTLNIGRKFASNSHSDAFFNGKVFEFTLHSEELSGETIKNISKINKR